MLSRQIEATDGAIDKLVYELYGLTGEEIRDCERKCEMTGHEKNLIRNSTAEFLIPPNLSPLCTIIFFGIFVHSFREAH